MLRYLYRHWASFSSLILGTTFGAMANMAILGWGPVWLVRRFAWTKTEIGLHLGIISLRLGLRAYERTAEENRAA